MLINWICDLSFDPVLKEKMQTAADLCLKTEGVSATCSVSVRLCDDQTIEAVNSEFRGIDKSTDVLSFPTINYPSGKTAGTCENLIRREYDDETDTCFLGDIVISVPHIYSQAAEYGHNVEREAVFLLVHGICHLMGYDHIEDKDRIKMREIENRIMSSIAVFRNAGISDDDRLLIQKAADAMQYSYSPYSHFPVGAAIRTSDGLIYTGCNVENVSFGLTNCAERTAVFKAVSDGKRSFDAIAIAANQTPWPCGACRQVLAEFSPNIRILLYHDGTVIEKNLSELLPYSIDLDIKET